MAKAWDIMHSNIDTDENTVRLARLCSRDQNGLPACSGDASGWCFRCIMETKWSLDKKRRALAKVLTNPKFLNAEGDNGNIQVMLLTEVHGVLLQGRALRLYDSGRMFNNDVINYLDFLNAAGLCEALPKLAKVRLPVSPDTAYDRQWYSVGYYCVSIPGLVARFEAGDRFKSFGIRPGPNYYKRVVSSRNEFMQRTLDSGIMRDVLGMISGSRGLIELLRAPWTLKGIISAYPTSCRYLVDSDGIATLCKMFAPGFYQQMVSSRIKAGLMNYDRTLLGVDHGGGTQPASNPFRMSDQELINYLSSRTISVLEDVGNVLVSVCKSNRAYCLQLLEHSPSVVKWLRWFKVPLLEPGDIPGIKVATKLLLTLLKQGEKPVHILIENYNLLGLLEKVLFLPYDFLVETFLQALKIILATGGEPRKMVIIRSEILLAVACLIHTSIYSLQTMALEILIDLLKDNSKHQLITLIEKHVLRKVNVVVGLAATTRDKEMNALWKQLDDCIITHCDRYMELAADDDRRRIRDSKVLTTKEKVDSRQDDLRKRGNGAFLKGRYWTAIEEYTVGILVASMPSCDIDSVLYSNRAECYLRVHMYEKAVLDATRAINCMFNRSSVYSKTCFRRAKALFAMGRYYEAYNDVAVCVKADPKEEKFQELYSMLADKWKNGEFVEVPQPSFSNSNGTWKEKEEKGGEWKREQLEMEKMERERHLMEESEELEETLKEKEKKRWFLNKERVIEEMRRGDGDRKIDDEEKEMRRKKSKVYVCAECGREAPGMKKCARCSTHFCNKTCQSKAWPKHKLVCK